MSDAPKKPPYTTNENDAPGDKRPLFRELLSRAHDMGLAHIKTKAISISDLPERRAVFKATVTMRSEDGFLNTWDMAIATIRTPTPLSHPTTYAWPKPELSPGRCAGLPTRDAPVRKKCRRMMVL